MVAGRATCCAALLALMLHSDTSHRSVPQWRLAWSDEFDQPDGSPPDPRNWSYDVGGNGWGNRELQYYTRRSPDNVVVEKGALSIRALHEPYTGPDGVTRSFTSARLHTKGRFSSRYGRFEARIKIPMGKGLWPAFWLLGDNVDTVGWPQCGEIDILENIGSEPSTVHGAVHGPGYSGPSDLGGMFTLPRRRQFADEFHVFAAEWEPDTIRLFVDTVLYRTVRARNLQVGWQWVFDHPFFVIVNIAVGGNWPGSPDTSTVFPQAMQIDYVRVFQRNAH